MTKWKYFAFPLPSFIHRTLDFWRSNVSLNFVTFQKSCWSCKLFLKLSSPSLHALPTHSSLWQFVVVSYWWNQTPPHSISSKPLWRLSIFLDVTHPFTKLLLQVSLTTSLNLLSWNQELRTLTQSLRMLLTNWAMIWNVPIKEILWETMPTVQPITRNKYPINPTFCSVIWTVPCVISTHHRNINKFQIINEMVQLFYLPSLMWEVPDPLAFFIPSNIIEILMTHHLLQDEVAS